MSFDNVKYKLYIIDIWVVLIYKFYFFFILYFVIRLFDIDYVMLYFCFIELDEL